MYFHDCIIFRLSFDCSGRVYRSCHGTMNPETPVTCVTHTAIKMCNKMEINPFHICHILTTQCPRPVNAIHSIRNSHSRFHYIWSTVSTKRLLAIAQRLWHNWTERSIWIKLNDNILYPLVLVSGQRVTASWKIHLSEEESHLPYSTIYCQTKAEILLLFHCFFHMTFHSEDFCHKLACDL